MLPSDLNNGTEKLSVDSNQNQQAEEEGRPFKKAKYAWQVKGKYHLKSNSNRPMESLSDSVIGNNNNDRINIQQSHGTATVPPSRCCIASITDSMDLGMDYSDSSDEETVVQVIDKNLIPTSLVKPVYKNRDYYLTKWQARQIARGYLDNSVNEILEKWMTIAPPIDIPDFADFYEDDEEVEDEGIMMAIQSHGLQSATQYLRRLKNYQQEQDHLLIQSNAAKEALTRSSMDNLQNMQSESLKRKKDEEPTRSASDGVEIGNHTDFLDAAVAVAIQKKGLSSQNYL